VVEGTPLDGPVEAADLPTVANEDVEAAPEGSYGAAKPRNGLSVTWAVHQPARASTLVKMSSSRSGGFQPGLGTRPRSLCQSRKGNTRRPDRIELRAGTVGIASGNAFGKRAALRTSASIAGVWARGPSA